MLKIWKCSDCGKEIDCIENVRYCSECGDIMCIKCYESFAECEACYDADNCGL